MKIILKFFEDESNYKNNNLNNLHNTKKIEKTETKIKYGNLFGNQLN